MPTAPMECQLPVLRCAGVPSVTYQPASGAIARGAGREWEHLATACRYPQHQGALTGGARVRKRQGFRTRRYSPKSASGKGSRTHSVGCCRSRSERNTHFAFETTASP